MTGHLFLGTCAVGLMLLLTGCKETISHAAASPPPEVEVAPVLTKQIRLSNEFNGRVSSINAVEIRARVSGYIERVAYREGAEVKRGDLLFLIDPRPYRDALKNAKAVLERARAAAEFAKIQAKRAETLDAVRAIAHEEFQNRTSNVIQTDASVQEAEANVATAELNLSFTEVRSPISGRTGRAQLTPGNLAQADQSILTTVVSQDPIYVYFECDEQSYLRYKSRVRGGERVSSANPVRVGLANETGFPHPGKIDFLDNEVNPSTGTIRARVVVSNPNRTFTPGLYARVQLQDSSTILAALIDDKAILTDQDRKYVYVLGADNKAMRKNVVLGPISGGLRVIESGLDPDDKIIVAGLQKIFYPGAPVTPKAAVGISTAALDRSAN